MVERSRASSTRTFFHLSTQVLSLSSTPQEDQEVFGELAAEIKRSLRVRSEERQLPSWFSLDAVVCAEARPLGGNRGAGGRTADLYNWPTVRVAVA